MSQYHCNHLRVRLIRSFGSSVLVAQRVGGILWARSIFFRFPRDDDGSDTDAADASPSFLTVISAGKAAEPAASAGCAEVPHTASRFIGCVPKSDTTAPSHTSGVLLTAVSFTADTPARCYR